MAGERRLRILARLLGADANTGKAVGRGDRMVDTRRLCEVCAEVTGQRRGHHVDVGRRPGRLGVHDERRECVD